MDMLPLPRTMTCASPGKHPPERQWEGLNARGCNAASSNRGVLLQKHHLPFLVAIHMPVALGEDPEHT